MKKLLCVLATGIALSVCATTVYLAKTANGSAADSDGVYNNSEITRASAEAGYDCNVCGQNYVDVDGDGICDNKGNGHGNGECGKNYVDADGDGVCDNKGNGHGNGVCDNKGNGHGNGNCGDNGNGHGNGNCGGKGSGHGNGNGSRGGCGR